MKGDPVELTPRVVFVAVLYAAAKMSVIYFFFASVAENLTEEIPEHATLIHVFAAVLGAAAAVHWVLRVAPARSLFTGASGGDAWLFTSAERGSRTPALRCRVLGEALIRLPVRRLDPTPDRSRSTLEPYRRGLLDARMWCHVSQSHPPHRLGNRDIPWHLRLMAGSCSTLPSVLPFVGIAGFILVWGLRTGPMGTSLLPGPWAVALAIGELAINGTLWKHLVASLFRVTWGFGLGAAVGIPLGLVLTWFPRGERAFNPFVQILRPISPLAWTPLAILWFGVGDIPAIFIIFLGTVLPVTVTAMNAVGSVDQVHVNVARNFGLSSWHVIRRVVLPSAWPQLVTGLRMTLGIAWLVVVAAEMLAVTSGLGFLVIDSRNAGDRYDVVVAGMVLIGLTGLGLDGFMKSVSSSVRRVPAVPAGHP